VSTQLSELAVSVSSARLPQAVSTRATAASAAGALSMRVDDVRVGEVRVEWVHLDNVMVRGLLRRWARLLSRAGLDVLVTRHPQCVYSAVSVAVSEWTVTLRTPCFASDDGKFHADQRRCPARNEVLTAGLVQR
ncbi:hypothetical protein, partial [Phytoactinopolyspora endophytica]|uniref:hypothetical protein n=1 Tax=Phytoactinopolyspora endophytica TaxID=1642495 RepID=UPI00197BA36D